LVSGAETILGQEGEETDYLELKMTKRVQ